jgi:putative flippase GtrA
MSHYNHKQASIRGEVARFATTGLANTAIDWSIYFALTRMLTFFSQGLLLAKAMGFLGATVFSFMVNRHWTFNRSSPVEPEEIIKFYLTVGSSLLINTYSMYIFLPLVGGNDVPALIMATIITATWNFFFLKFWVYAKAPITNS